MTDEQLAALERLARAATPGEWRIGGCGRNRWIAAGDEWIAHFSTAGSPAAADADAAYIAAAQPGTMLALIAAVRAQQGAVKIVTQSFGEVCDALGCAHDSEAALAAVSALRRLADAAGADALAEMLREERRRALREAAEVVDCGCTLAPQVMQAVAAGGTNCAERWRLCPHETCRAIEAAAIHALAQRETPA